MQKELINNPEILVMGFCTRANNTTQIHKIGELVAEYFSKGWAEKIPYRKTPGITISGFTDYASDEHGDYTYFIGEMVTHVELIEPLCAFTIPQGEYIKFTTSSGKMPEVIINTWRQIWQMSPKDLGGNRNYRFDYELYDQRAADPHHTVADIYIGVDTSINNG